MKKIISIISIALVALLVGATITLACVKTNTMDAVKTLGDYDKIDYVKVYKGGSEYQSFTIQNDKEVIEKIVSLYKDSLKDNTLSALFQGATGFDPTLDTLDTALTRSEIVKDNISVSFHFSEKLNLKWDGKNVLTSNEKNVEFSEIIMQLNNSKNYADVAVYVVNASNASLYKLNTIAHQSDLYDYINKMDYSGN